MAIAREQIASPHSAPDNHPPTLPASDDSTQRQINQVFDRSPLAVFGVDAKGLIRYWNPICAELFRLPASEQAEGLVEELHCADLLCGGDSQCGSHCCIDCIISEAIQSEKQIKAYELTIQSAHGQPTTVSVSTCYFYQSNPEGISTYFSLRPIDNNKTATD